MANKKAQKTLSKVVRVIRAACLLLITHHLVISVDLKLSASVEARSSIQIETMNIK